MKQITISAEQLSPASKKPLTRHQEQAPMLRAYQNFVVVLPRFIYELPEVFKHILLR